MSNKPEQVSTVCSKNKQLNRLSKRARHLSQLNYILQQVMPPQFSAHCQLANINEQTLIVHTDNASYASLLRFQANTLCKALSEHLPQAVTKLEVKVRPKYSPIRVDTKSTISLPEDAADALEQTAETMEESPLKSALQRLAQRRSK